MVEDLSDVQKLQIKSATIQYFKDSTEYLDKLIEYGTTVFVECIDYMIKLRTKRRVEMVVLILVKAKAPYRVLSSSIQKFQMELSEVSPATGEDKKVGSQWPPEEEGGPYPLPDPIAFDDIPRKDPL